MKHYLDRAFVDYTIKKKFKRIKTDTAVTFVKQSGKSIKKSCLNRVQYSVKLIYISSYLQGIINTGRTSGHTRQHFWPLLLSPLYSLRS